MAELRSTCHVVLGDQVDTARDLAELNGGGAIRTLWDKADMPKPLAP